MSAPRLESLTCAHPGGTHRMAWWSWGDPSAAHVVVCVHGLTRQGRDFDWLAQVLLDQAQAPLHIVCPDVVGRGQSDWLPEPVHYQLPQYAADMLALLAQRQARCPMVRLDWVGTSMGGLIGMALAAQPDGALPVPVSRLVLNDVGPAITWSSVERMQQFVGRFGRFASLSEAAVELRRLSAGFGAVPEAVWRALCAPMVRELPDGGCTLHYDPAIAHPLRALTPEAAMAGQDMLWGVYEQIRAQVLLIRGMQSDLLTEETALAMTQRGPCARLVQWPDVGHAPTLTDPAHCQVVADFLLATNA